MKKFYRTRLLLKGLNFYSALRCIISLMKFESKNSKDFSIKYKKYGNSLKAFVRAKHLRSDLQSVLELAAGDYYRLDKIFWEPDIIIDGGANTGLFTLASSAKWPLSKIKCFEPLPENLDLIKKHIQINNISNRIELFPVAIGDSNRTTKFYIRDANQGSLDKSSAFSEVLDIEVINLLNFYKKISKKRVIIKLDIEGAEFEIMSDFFNHMPHSQLLFLMEVHGNKNQQDTLLYEARKAGFVGDFWEQSFETAHLFLASNDVGVVFKNIIK